MTTHQVFEMQIIKKYSHLLLFLTVLSSLTACGGGGGSSDDEVSGVGIAKNAQIIKE